MTDTGSCASRNDSDLAVEPAHRCSILAGTGNASRRQDHFVGGAVTSPRDSAGGRGFFCPKPAPTCSNWANLVLPEGGLPVVELQHVRKPGGQVLAQPQLLVEFTKLCCVLPQILEVSIRTCDLPQPHFGQALVRIVLVSKRIGISFGHLLEVNVPHPESIQLECGEFEVRKRIGVSTRATGTASEHAVGLFGHATELGRGRQCSFRVSLALRREWVVPEQLVPGSSVVFTVDLAEVCFAQCLVDMTQLL